MKIVLLFLVFTVAMAAAPAKKSKHPDLIVKGGTKAGKLVYKGIRTIL